jgi:hypothetical protein
MSKIPKETLQNVLNEKEMEILSEIVEEKPSK